MDRKPLAVSASFSGLEDAAGIRVVLGADALDAGESIAGFTVATLPVGGMLYLDAAMQVAVVEGQFIETESASLELFFKPAADFNGQVSFAYTATEAKAVAGAASAERYYLTIDGLDARGLVSGYEGAFELADFRFDLEALTGLSGGGGGAGKVAPGPLDVTFAERVPFDLLMGLAAGGKFIPALRIEGVVSGEGGLQTVYDLRFEGVSIDVLSEGAGEGGGAGRDVAFAYQAVSLTTRGLDADGGLGPAQTVSWNGSSGVVGDTPLAAAQVGSGPTSFSLAREASEYFLTIDGLGGSTTQRGYEGAFPVASFDFEIETITAPAGGGLVGKAAPGPLVIRLAPGEATGDLLAAAASGELLPRLRLDGILRDRDAAETVYDLRLEDVLVTRIEDDTGVATLELAYRKVSLTVGDGSTTDSARTVSWDTSTGLVSETQLGEAAAAAPVTSRPADDHYLTISGVDGGVQREGHVGSFAVDAFEFDIALAGAQAALDGALAGKPTPGPLVVAFNGDAAPVALLGHIAAGGVLPLVRLEGVANTPDGSLGVYDLRLANAYVTRLVDGDGNDSMHLVYSAMSLTTRGIRDDGTLGAPRTVSWDLETLRVGDEPLGAARAGGDDAPTPASEYYLTLGGIGGNSVQQGHEGKFEVVGFELGVESALGLLQGGVVISDPQALPLVVRLADGSPMSDVIQRAAAGAPIDLVRLEGVVVVDEDARPTVYDLRLADVTVTRVAEGADGVRLELAYTKLTLETTVLGGGDKTSGSSTVSWDLETGVVTDVSTVEDAKPGAVFASEAATGHFLTMDGMNGGVLERGYEGAFAVADFDFDITLALAGGIGGGGSGAGKANAGPLIVELGDGAGLAPLVAAAASGKVLPLVRLEGVAAADEGLQTIYDLRLADVQVRLVRDAAGVDRIELDYRAMSLTNWGLNPDGSPKSDTVSWNLESGVINAIELDSATASPGAGTPTSASAWFLTLDGVNGGSAVEGHEGSFSVEDFSFAIELLQGDAAGKALARPLVLTLADGVPPSSLLGSLVTGSAIPLARLQGVMVGDGGMQTVYDLRLEGVRVTRLQDGDGDDVLELSFSAMSLSTRGIDARGVLGPETTVSWNVVTGVVADDRLAAAQPRLVDAGQTSDPGTITIDVTPVNDAAVIGGATSGTIAEDATPALLTGQLTVSDIDSPAVFAVVDQPQASDQGHGRFTVTAAGQWTYLPDNLALAVDLLEDGQSLTDTFTVRAADGTPQVVGVTITGVSDTGNVIAASQGQAPVRGSGGFDTILVDASNRLVTAGGGDDRFLLEPPDGPQLLVGGRGNDTVDFRFVDGGLRLDLRNGFARLGEGNAVVHMTSVEHAAGGDGNDTLAGDAGGNLLDGRGGDDVLRGRGGADTLVGGAGADTFVFDDGDSGATAARRDLILDFEPGVDRIDLSRIDAVQQMPGDQAFRPTITAWNGSGQPFAPNTPGRIAWHHEVIGGVTWTVIDLNTDRDAAADMQIALRGLFTFGGTGDFVL